MRFNPDPKIQAQGWSSVWTLTELIICFNQNLVKSSTHKHLGMVLDTKLDFVCTLKTYKTR